MQSIDICRCPSVERLDIVEEEEEDREAPFRHFINKQEVLAEDETEEEGSDSDGRVLSPIERKAANSNILSQSKPGPNHSVCYLLQIYWYLPAALDLPRSRQQQLTENVYRLPPAVPEDLCLELSLPQPDLVPPLLPHARRDSQDG